MIDSKTFPSVQDEKMDKTYNILAVDDEAQVTLVLKRVLEQEGYTVTTSNDGYAALAMVVNSPPDLVILDINMPGINGYQVLKRIREEHDIPVIMLSANQDVSCIDNTIGLGADDYIRKPFHLRELSARVKAKLRRVRK
jgi:DNA-binding response OmpR family regulator